MGFWGRFHGFARRPHIPPLHITLFTISAIEKSESAKKYDKMAKNNFQNHKKKHFIKDSLINIKEIQFSQNREKSKIAVLSRPVLAL